MLISQFYNGCHFSTQDFFIKLIAFFGQNVGFQNNHFLFLGQHQKCQVRAWAVLVARWTEILKGVSYRHPCFYLLIPNFSMNPKHFRAFMFHQRVLLMIFLPFGDQQKHLITMMFDIFDALSHGAIAIAAKVYELGCNFQLRRRNRVECNH